MSKYVTIAEYTELTGRCRSQVIALIRNGELEHTTTPGGRKYLIKLPEENIEAADLRAEIADLKNMMSVMMSHFGIGGKNETINFNATRPIRRA